MKLRHLVAPAALAVALLGSSLGAGHAHAAYIFCRTDPIVMLTNGTQLNVTASSSGGITHAQYVIHGPVGTAVRKVTFTNNVPAGFETVQYMPDQTAANSFRTMTVATTATRGAIVQVKAAIYSNGKALGSATASGLGGTVITINQQF